MKIKERFILDIVEKELGLYNDGFYDSIMSNPWDKNLFLVFENKEQVIEYLSNL